MSSTETGCSLSLYHRERFLEETALNRIGHLHHMVAENEYYRSFIFCDLLVLAPAIMSSDMVNATQGLTES